MRGTVYKKDRRKKVFPDAFCSLGDDQTASLQVPGPLLWIRQHSSPPWWVSQYLGPPLGPYLILEWKGR